MAVTALIVNRVQPRFSTTPGWPTSPTAAAAGRRRWAAWSRTSGATRRPPTGTSAAFADLMARVAPAPVARVPLLNSDVHDLDGLGLVADLLFGGGRTGGPAAGPEAGGPVPGGRANLWLCAPSSWPVTPPPCGPRSPPSPPGPTSSIVEARSGPEVLVAGGRVAARPGDRRPADGEHGRHGRLPRAAARGVLRQPRARAGADAARPPTRRVPGPPIGAEGWVVKPLDPIRLRRAVTALLDGGTYYDESYRPLSVVRRPPSPPAAESTAGSPPRPCSDATKTRTPGTPGAGRSPRTAARPRVPRGVRARVTGAGDAQEQFIIEALEDLRDTEVREVMTPRVDVVALTIPVTADDVTRAIRESGPQLLPGLRRQPRRPDRRAVRERPLPGGWRCRAAGSSSRRRPSTSRRRCRPRPAGAGAGAEPVLPDPLDISRRLRQPFLVPESRLVLDVLAEMRRQRRAFAVVVDEHGGVEGVLTVKDLLGALVGDLPDEFDPDDEPDDGPGRRQSVAGGRPDVAWTTSRAARHRPRRRAST